MIRMSVAARITCDCSNDGRTDVCGADVVGYGWTDGNARRDAEAEAWVAGWVFDAPTPLRPWVRHLHPDHVVQDVVSGAWVRPVSLVKAYV